MGSSPLLLQIPPQSLDTVGRQTVARVMKDLLPLGKRVGLTIPANNAQYVTTVDTIVMVCRVDLETGLSNVLDFLASESTLKVDVFSENSLIALTALLYILEASQEDFPSGELCPMWHTPSPALPSDPLLKSPYTAMKQYSARAALGIPITDVTMVGLGHSKAHIQSVLARKQGELSRVLGAFLQVCDTTFGSSLLLSRSQVTRDRIFNFDRERPGLTVYRMVLCCCAFFMPAAYTVEDFFGHLAKALPLALPHP